MRLTLSFIVTLSLFSSFLVAEPKDGLELDVDLTNWIDFQKKASVQHLENAIEPAGTVPGAVVACPTKRPNDGYYKHWIRDSALTMKLVVHFIKNPPPRDAQEKLDGPQFDPKEKLKNFAAFSRQLQNTPNWSDELGARLGEPVFFPTGAAFNHGWGRPQNDGAGLRAITLTAWAMELLEDRNQEEYVRSVLYDGKLPATTVIKSDLEFISHLWDEDKGLTDSCFDLWEEIKGQHFYTKMVQRKALLDGEKLARKLGDPGAGDWYKNRAAFLEAKILDHWRFSDQMFYSTIDREEGRFKRSGLDSAVILAVLHGDTQDSFMPVNDDRVIATGEKISQRFQREYDINKDPKIPGIAIGRYPEDQYDGVSTNSKGSPWILLTNAYAEWHYRMAKKFRADGEIKISKLNESFFKRIVSDDPEIIKPGLTYKKGDPKFSLLWSRIVFTGDNYLRRVKHHAPGDGSLAEQMNRDKGNMQGASDLAWSHASLLTAVWERDALGKFTP